MKKNGDYVGVDEKYIPEDEKYVDNSANEEIKDSVNDGLRSVKDYITKKDNQEKFKNAGKKGLKIAKNIGIGYLVFIGLIFVIVITVFVLVFSQIFKVGNKIDNTSNSIQDKINNSNKNTESADSFNSTFEMYTGIKFGMTVNNLLNEISTNNKKSEHIIKVVYNDISTSSSDDILDLMNSIESSKEYRTSLDYDKNGFANKLTILDK